MKGGKKEMRNTKGLSTVVTTLIIILLVFVAIGIVWAVVQGIFTRGTEQVEGGLDCATTMLVVESAGKNLTHYKVVVSRDATGIDEAVTKVILVFGDGNTTQTYTKDGITLNQLGKDTTHIAFDDIKLEDMDGNANTVSVAAVIGGKTCNPAGEKTIA
mgnify:CR=1 FL=1